MTGRVVVVGRGLVASVAVGMALVMIAGTGCVRPVIPGVPGLERDSVTPRRPDRPQSDRRGTASRKRVVAKEPVSTLVAGDGTRCIVSEDRYRETTIGDEVGCVWYSASSLSFPAPSPAAPA